jgi:hypothetical protein
LVFLQLSHRLFHDANEMDSSITFRACIGIDYSFWMLLEDPLFVGKLLDHHGWLWVTLGQHIIDVTKFEMSIVEEKERPELIDTS